MIFLLVSLCINGNLLENSQFSQFSEIKSI